MRKVAFENGHFFHRLGDPVRGKHPYDLYLFFYLQVKKKMERVSNEEMEEEKMEEEKEGKSLRSRVARKLFKSGH